MTLHKDDIENLRTAWKASIVTGDPFSVEYRRRRADGEYIWFLGKCNPVLDNDGKIVRWLGLSTDIHALKIAELNLTVIQKELHLERQLMDAVIAHLPIALLASRPSGEIFLANARMASIFSEEVSVNSSNEKEDPKRWKGIHDDGSPYTDEDWVSSLFIHQKHI